SVRKVLSAYQTSIKADALLKIAKAVLTLTAAVIALTFVDADKLQGGLIAVSVLFGEVAAALIILDKLNVNGFQSSGLGVAIMGFAAGVAILAVALKQL